LQLLGLMQRLIQKWLLLLLMGLMLRLQLHLLWRESSGNRSGATSVCGDA